METAPTEKGAPAVYRERLRVPIRWWVLGVLFVVSLWLAVIVAVPGATPWVVGGLALALLAGLLLGYGAPRVVVAGGELRAGRAHIGAEHLGEARALDREETSRAAGREADARAYLLLRPYLRRAVKVAITDPADPAPYWLISTRRPDDLAAAIEALPRS